MEKILISDPSEEDDILIAGLRILFPECEIQIQSKGKKGLGHIQTAPGPPSADDGVRRNGKHPNYR